MYRCRIWNEIEEGFEYSTFYRKPGKSFHSKLITDPVDLSLFITSNMRGISSVKNRFSEKGFLWIIQISRK